MCPCFVRVQATGNTVKPYPGYDYPRKRLLLAAIAALAIFAGTLTIFAAAAALAGIAAATSGLLAAIAAIAIFAGALTVFAAAAALAGIAAATCGFLTASSFLAARTFRTSAFATRHNLDARGTSGETGIGTWTNGIRHLQEPLRTATFRIAVHEGFSIAVAVEGKNGGQRDECQNGNAEYDLMSLCHDEFPFYG